MNVFLVVAIAFAAWAVALTVLGLRNARFPGREGGARVIAAVTFVLAGAGLATASMTSAEEAHKREAEERKHEQERTPPPADPGLRVEADPQGKLQFERTQLETTAGRRTLELVNNAPMGHNVGIAGQGIDVVGPTVPPGQISRVTAELRPGRYVFYCGVLGHREGGMEGTLVVR